MGERSSHPPGTFSWADLTTTDTESAKRFYATVLGWDYADLPAGEGRVYTMAHRDGHEVAAMGEDPAQLPHWNTYVTVDSADVSAERAGELGGTVVMPAFDVMDAGRMAVIQDPTGAMLCLWEPRGNIGARLVNAPGAMTWDDLVTTDIDAAERFYRELFGWTTSETPEAGGYRVIMNRSRSNGGMLPRRPEMGDMPSNWTPYFGVADLEEAQRLVTEAGGQVVAGPQAVPAGAFIVISDPQGAVCSLWAGEFDD